MSESPFTKETLLFEPAVPDDGAAPVVFAFPNTYTVGITSLGYQIVWATLAQRRDLAVSRLFTDHHEPLPATVDLLGFSVSWELDYGGLMGLLETLEVPIYGSDRTLSHPLVFGGGPVLTANPEPFAPFFDVILLGDGETLLDDFIDAYQQVRGCERLVQLKHLAQVPGVYVPALYGVQYQDSDGPVAAIQPLYPDVPSRVQKQTYRGNVLSASTVVTELAAWENIYMVEV
ncbi:radical SAM protein, partial [filamentous cyanobacterium CCP5]